MTGIVMAFDLGDKWIGCALSDSKRVIVSPLPAIEAENEFNLARVRKLVKEYQVVKVLVGVPALTDGQPTSQSKKYRGLARKIQKHLSEIDVEIIDETLSTWSTKEHYKKLKLQKGQGDSNVGNLNVDSFTAMELLNQYLKLSHYSSLNS